MDERDDAVNWVLTADMVTLQFAAPSELPTLVSMLKILRSDDPVAQMQLDGLIVRLGGTLEPHQLNYELFQQ